jgi:hypothetical protein
MELQREMGPGFNFFVAPRKCLPVHDQMSFRGRDRDWVRKNMITLFFTGRELIVLDLLPKHRKENQLDFVHTIFPDLKEENMRYQRRKPG